MTTARLRSRARRLIRSMTVRPLCESSAAVGSSASMMCGSPARARAMATRCFWPPLRSAGRLPYFSLRPTWSRRAAACRRTSRPRAPLSFRASSTFSPAVRAGNRLNPWNTNPMLASRIRGSCFSFSCDTSCPKMRTLPELARKMQPMMDNRVVLPLPEGPMSRTSSPGCTSRSTSSRARKRVVPEE